jgi:CSLREA domain-containing protein
VIVATVMPGYFPPVMGKPFPVQGRHYKVKFETRMTTMFESRRIDASYLATATCQILMTSPGRIVPASAPRNGWRKTMRPICTALAALCLFAAPTCAGQSAIWTVNTLADSNDGSCTPTICSLRDAITAANSDSGDYIYLLNLVGTITLTSPLPAITADMIFMGPGFTTDYLEGPYGMNLLTVSGNNLYPVFTITSGHVAIYGLVIANGYNSANGGGIYVGSSGILELFLCTISGSYARYGGGIANYGYLEVNYSTISGNSTSNVGAGGGIYNAPSTTLYVTNSTFTGNSSPLTSGGAIYIDAGSTATLTNITVSGNSANTDGGLHVESGSNANPTTVKLDNSILTGNTNNDCASCATAPSAAFSFANNYGYIGGISGGTAPALGPLQWNGGPTQTMMPLPGSSAICAGSTAFINSAFGDQRLFSLPSGDCSAGKLDQGAVQSMYLTVNSTADTATGTLTSCTGGGGICTLRDAIHVAMNDTGTAANNSRNDGDIIFDSSVFGTVQKTITLGSSLDTINSALNIQGPGASLLTVDGNGSSGSGVTNSILYMISSPYSFPHTSAEVNVSGLTLTNGVADPAAQEGGAIYNDGALSVVNSVISGSGTAGSGSGGGIYNDSPGKILITGSTVSGNSAADGAGILNSNFSEMLVMDSTISGNTAPSGGGDGGGICNGGPLQLINSTLTGNTASDGGGIYNTGKNAVLQVTDSTISGNTAWNDDFPTATPAPPFGGGGGIDVYNDGSDGNGLVTVTNSIIAGNASNGSDDLEACTPAAVTAGCTVPVTDQYDLIDTVAHTSASGAYNIALGSLAFTPSTATTQTMMPGPGSVTIQGGSVAEVPLGLTTDQRGFPRLTGGKVDIGAVQTNYTSITFSQQPTTSIVNEFLATDPQVTLVETNSNTSATDYVSGVPVTLTFSGAAFMIGGALTETTNAGGMADFSGLKVNTTGTYTFSVAGSLAATGTTVTSNTFDVTSLAPTVTSVSPSFGLPAGGTMVTVTGTKFTSATAVKFGTTVATGFTVNSATQITATSPAGVAGVVDVTVTSPGGTSTTSAADQFTYIAPAPASLTTNSGSPQSAYITMAFGASLQATVLDQYSNPYSGATVTFTAPSRGASATFSNSTNTITVITNGSGVASSGTLTANGTAGSYSVSAAVTGLPSVNFSLTNTAMPHYIVTSLVDDVTGVPGNCSNQNLNGATLDNDCNLRDAIAAASAVAQTTVTPLTTSLMPTITFVATLCTAYTGSTCNTTITPAVGNAGTYNVTTGGTLTISKNMNITGPGANLLSIDGGKTVGVFNVKNLITVSISGLTIIGGNTGSGGGGIFNAGTLTVTNCTFSGNNAGDFGGGIQNRFILTVTNSTFSGNTAGVGGAIENDDAMTVTNSTFSGNTAIGPDSRGGGGIMNDYAGMILTNSTFSGNTAQVNPSSAGIFIEGNPLQITMTNNLIPDAIQGSYTDNGGNVTAGSANLAPLVYYGGPTKTMMPLPGSAAICSGTLTPANNNVSGVPITIPTTDQRGNPRPISAYGGSCVDAGAVQTAYSLAFAQSPSATQQAGVTLTPTSAVQLYDNGNIINLPGAPISVTLNSGTLAGAANPYTTGSTGLATFAGLSVPTATSLMNDFLTASTAVGPYTITAKSTNFNVISITLSPTTLPAAQIGVTYSQQITASGGTAPYTYSAAGLPLGMSMNASTGTITGTPKSDTASPYNVTVTASDSLGGSSNQLYLLTVNPPVITLSPATLTSGIYRTSYSQSVSASGGIAPYTYALAGGSSLPPGLSMSSSGAITGTPSQARATAYTFTINATDSSTGTGPYTGSQLVSLTINQASATISVTPYTVTYDGTSHTATGTATGVNGANLSAGLTLSGTTHTSAGTYASDSWSFTDSTGNYANTSGTVTDSISKATPAVAITLTSGTNPVFAQTPITFTTAVTATVGVPTGTVTFYDNGVVVTSCVGVTLTSGVATCTINGPTSALAVGSNIIAASYSGDSNFSGESNILPQFNTASTGYAESLVDFDFVMSNPVLTVTPGQSIQYTFTVSPLSPATTFPGVITFTAGGLPDGATYSFSPSSVGPCTSGTCATTVTLTIQTPGSLSAVQAEPGAGGNLAARLSPFFLAFLLLPFAGRLRKAGKRFSRLLPVLLLLAGLAAMAGMSGCGATIGFFGQTQHTYTVTVTGASGALSHTSNITLTVE